MREYSSREEAEQDPYLNLKIVWECNRCGQIKEEYPHCNEGGRCEICHGGTYEKVGESYNV